MPKIVTGNLDASTIMIAEKIADKIRGRQVLKNIAYYIANTNGNIPIKSNIDDTI